MRIDPKPNPCRAPLAGALGGLIACFAMSQFHSFFQKMESSAEDKEEDSTVKTASGVSLRLFHHELTPLQKQIAGPVVHYGFGASIGALYGGTVEVLPVLRAGWGMPFGVAVWLGAHVISVPALGLSEPVTRSTPRREAVEFGAHLVYGAVVESVRHLLRKMPRLRSGLRGENRAGLIEK
jgi:putative membrane protein